MANLAAAIPPEPHLKSGRLIIQRALQASINVCDIADNDSDGRSEAIVRQALKAFDRRNEVVLTTQVHYPGQELSQGLTRLNPAKSMTV